MVHKQISYRRKQRARMIKHREYICLNVYQAEPGTGFDKIPGKLNKGKVHCSCPLCSGKTRRNQGIRNRSICSWKISDQKQIESMRDKLEDLYVA